MTAPPRCMSWFMDLLHWKITNLKAGGLSVRMPAQWDIGFVPGSLCGCFIIDRFMKHNLHLQEHSETKHFLKSQHIHPWASEYNSNTCGQAGNQHWSKQNHWAVTHSGMVYPILKMKQLEIEFVGFVVVVETLCGDFLTYILVLEFNPFSNKTRKDAIYLMRFSCITFAWMFPSLLFRKEFRSSGWWNAAD